MNHPSHVHMAASAMQRHVPSTFFFLCSLPRPNFSPIARIQNAIPCRSRPLRYWQMTRITGSRNSVLRSEEGRVKAFGRRESGSSDAPDTMLEERFPFDINLAVVLAGFAFEAYNTPSDASGVHEVDPFDCKTIFLSETFLREVYEGQFLITLKKGYKFPGLDLWGTSDPYVVLRIGECVVRSKTMWATTEPVWNESFKINVKNPSTQYLQVAAWDANLVTDHRRLGNSGIDLQSLSDGEKHDVELELEGMGGGAVISLEVQYQCFDDISASRKGWSIPLLSDFLQNRKFEDVINNAIGLQTLTVSDFLRSVLGPSPEVPNESISEVSEASFQEHNGAGDNRGVSNNKNDNWNSDVKEEKASKEEDLSSVDEAIDKASGVGIQGLKFPSLDSVNWDALDVIKRLGLDSQNKAESQYIESGLAIASSKVEESSADVPALTKTTFLSDEDIKKASISLLKQTEATLKSWTVLSASLLGAQGKSTNKTAAIIEEAIPSTSNTDESMTSDEKLKELEELRKMFGKAESAMEAWAVLATSLGHKSFVKSAFEKLCFLDNDKTDTQVVIWRDAVHQRVVVSFRGTEQVKWKDLRTDLMLLPVSFNPERVGGEFNQEAMIHGGFLSAYDSVRNRLMSLVKASIGFGNNNTHPDSERPWHVHVTGHSLGGALATLFALELSMSKLARQRQIKVTMYNFGSPRVGNKKFAEQYNEIVRDSWRVVNHRDIIPTVPRLMGYCHVAHPIYLTAGDVYDATVNMELVGDGYEGDVIGEATPDFLLEEFMKGEKNLISKLLQTEVAMLRAIRDGSALMQHMEDFYYISLLENVSLRLLDKQEENK